MDSLSSAFYANLDFGALLPGLFKHGAPADCAPAASDPADPPHASTAPSAPGSAALSSAPSSAAPPPAGMPKKRNGARNSKHAKHKGQQKTLGSAPSQQIKARVNPSTAVTGPPPPRPTSASAALAAKDASAYPQQFYNDDLSATPLSVAPRAPKPGHRELPRVELEDGRLHSPAYSSSEHDADYYSAASYTGMHPADRKELEYDVDEDQLSTSSAFSDSPSFAYSDDNDYASDELDLDDDDEGSGSSAEDAPDDGFKLDESDERRPFPDPRLAQQQKYLRRAADFESKVDSDASAHVYVEAASPISPQSPTAFSPTAPVATAAHSFVPYIATPAPSAYPSASHATVHYAPVSGATYDDAADVADDFDPLDGPYPRGRSKHPRLLWRSALDCAALAVLDAHHDRVRGGPLPRLALAHAPADNTTGACLSASGVDREREHAGLEVDEVKERARRARRRDRGADGRRTWSQAGRKWSREIERVGL
ncbi:hypothetical protein JCM3770_002354 [Rhodotorula araucariae]